MHSCIHACMHGWLVGWMEGNVCIYIYIFYNNNNIYTYYYYYYYYICVYSSKFPTMRSSTWRPMSLPLARYNNNVIISI